MKFQTFWLPYFKAIAIIVGKWQFQFGILDTRWMMENQEGGLNIDNINKKFHKDMGITECPHCKEK